MKNKSKKNTPGKTTAFAAFAKAFATAFATAFAALCVTLLFTNCQTLMSGIREPVISFHSAELSGISFTGTELLCIVRVENPNSFDIPFPEIGWGLFINANSFVSGVVRNNQSIRARDATLVEVPVNLNYLEIFNTFASLKGRNQVDYRVALAVKFSLPVLRDMVWNLEHGGTLPLPQLPRVSSPSLRVESIDLGGVNLLASVNLENPNAFSLPAPKMSFDFLVNRSPFLSSTMDTAGPLAASSVTPVILRISVRFVDLFMRFQNLRNAGEAQTMLNLAFDFAIPVFGGEAVSIQIPGTIPLR